LICQENIAKDRQSRKKRKAEQRHKREKQAGSRKQSKAKPKEPQINAKANDRASSRIDLLIMRLFPRIYSLSVF